MRNIRTLQNVHAWLKTTENWVARMLANLPDTNVTILSGNFLPRSVHHEGFEYIRRTVSLMENLNRHFAGRAWNLGMRAALSLEDHILGHVLKGRFDILHSHFSFMGWKGMPIAKTMGIPHVVSFYGIDYECLPFTDPSWVKRYQILFREVDAFICEGRHGVDILKNMGCPEHKLQICRLGVDFSNISFPEAPPSREEGFQLIQLASLTAKKGHADAIRAFAIAHPRLPAGSRFTIVGKENDIRRSDLQILAHELGVAEAVEFVDGIDFSKLYDYLRKFHGFLHPSCYTPSRDCEGGAPVVLLDAQAVGVPVVSTVHCDIPDEVVDNATGFLAPEGDVSAIAERIVRLSLLDESRYQAMRKAGRAHVEAYFDAKKNSATLRDIYATAIEARGTQGTSRR